MMDEYEATRIVFSRLQNLDPENASKIMGLLLLQDQGEKEMIRLAFGPESLLHSMILKARNEFNFKPKLNLPSLELPLPNHSFPNPDDEFLTTPTNNNPKTFYNGGGDFVDEFQFQEHHHHHHQQQLSFLNDCSVNENPDFFYPAPPASPSGGNWSEEAGLGLGWRPCLYYARGFCKNGSGCRFFHSGGGDLGLKSMVPADGGAGAAVGSVGRTEMVEQCNDVVLLRSNSGLQQRLGVGSGNGFFPYSPTAASELLLHQQQNEMRRAVAGLSMVEESSIVGRFRLERTDFSGGGMGNPAARQIYLTFPAESCFKEEDVSKYFSIYGPVQDVRIPYQQKRMFGFVTFVYADTVKLILAKGNPHFVCDSRVLVKPYKEKGKVPDKFRKQQQIERGDFSSPCGTPTGLDSRDLHDLHHGARMYYNSQDMLWRRKLEEQADLQQALELQALRVMSLQLADLKKPHHHHIPLSTCSPIPSPIPSPNTFNQTLFHSIPTDSQLLQEDGSNRLPEIRIEPQVVNNFDSTADSDSSNGKETDLQETSLEHNLPDSPFASASYTPSVIEADESDASTDNHSAASSFIAAPFKSFNCQYSSGHGAIGLYASTGGPTCRVGI
ncbi:zinc finger CCCH domain-containing protein 53-like [Benincasa hispida]|uniref:zinc finger CCCH domain-containing protein 53-like n=1 Tax=Benincasa hispida TaxID=102211 RepID=UPI0018FF62ED|nr:zinc finger CCCH domain-containing protein 53-like [Benincasa hispida]